MKNNEQYENLKRLYNDNRNELELFMTNVRNFFEYANCLKGIVHTTKMRLKDPEHVIDKVKRKRKRGIIVDEENFFKEVTDLAGVRVLHLHLDQFVKIHNAIKNQVEEGEWCFVEEPFAYTWDPDSKKFFEGLGLSTKVKGSYYTSIHYLVKPNRKHTNVCCEIQVRTLFEEIWGEIDHSINYPHPTGSVACREELRVLARLTNAGSRLADAIFRSYEEYQVNIVGKK